MQIRNRSETQLKLERTSPLDQISGWLFGTCLIGTLGVLLFVPSSSVELTCRNRKTDQVTLENGDVISLSTRADCLAKEYWYWGLYKKHEVLIEDVTGAQVEVRERWRGRRGGRVKYCARVSLQTLHGSDYPFGGKDDCGSMRKLTKELADFLYPQELMINNNQDWHYIYANRNWTLSFIVFVLGLPILMPIFATSITFLESTVEPFLPKSFKQKESLLLDKEKRLIVWTHLDDEITKEYNLDQIHAIGIETCTSSVVISSEEATQGVQNFRVYIELQEGEQITINSESDRDYAEKLAQEVSQFLGVPLKSPVESDENKPKENST